MKTTKTLTLLAAMIPAACGQLPSSARGLTNAATDTSDADEAANELFLSDMTDAAADAGTTASSDPVDASVTDDVKPTRLQQMADAMFKELDLDGSGNLSLDEFLAGPAKRAEDKALDDEKKAKITATVTADFEKYAGDDKLLTSDELKTLLASVAPRIGQHRHKKHHGRHSERIKQSWEDITSKFDTDKDGKISKDEFEAMRAEHKEKNRQVKARGFGGRR